MFISLPLSLFSIPSLPSASTITSGWDQSSCDAPFRVCADGGGEGRKEKGKPLHRSRPTDTGLHTTRRGSHARV